MSTVTELTSREALPVTVGNCTVYCDNFISSESGKADIFRQDIQL